MKIVFMGTPDFALPSLQRLIASEHEVAAVYCQPDKPQGRHFVLTPPPVKVLAQQHDIPVCQPTTLKDEAAQAELEKFAPDIIVVAAYGKILPKAVLDMPKYGCINVHGSILPKYRGAAPIQWAVINGEKRSGVTIMQMAEGLDTGDMLLVRETEIGTDETAGELFDRIALLGADALMEALENIDSLTPVRQDDSLACWASPLKKSDGEIDWDKSAKSVYSLIRGVSPWPGAYTIFGEKRLKIHRARLCDMNGEPRRILDDERLIIGCGSGSIELIEVQLEGAKRMSAADFIRGRRLKRGDML